MKIRESGRTVCVLRIQFRNLRICDHRYLQKEIERFRPVLLLARIKRRTIMEPADSLDRAEIFTYFTCKKKHGF